MAKLIPGVNDLNTTNPELATEWHPALNGELTPAMVTLGSNKKVWWRCERGHEWEATPNTRHRGSKCPICNNRKVLAGYNDLATINPDLADEWHPAKNGTLLPSMVTHGSNKKVWWRCERGHEWDATINDRTRGSKCPICNNRKVLAGYNDLATVNPELAADWHPTLNGELTPAMVTCGSIKKIWWRGKKCRHEWEATVNDRQRYGCPICNSRMVLAGYNDLATVNPELAGEWHPTLNGELTPAMVTSGSNKKVWWRDKKCNHEWEARIADRLRGDGCPICDNKIVLPGFNDLATKNPELADEWHPTKNGTLTASMVTSGSDKKVWWRGKKCGHEWEATIGNRNRGRGCPICDTKIVLPGFNDLATKNPELVDDWNPTMNGKLTSAMVASGSDKKIWWRGKKCGHEWRATVKDRHRGSGCPICEHRTQYNKKYGF